MIATLMVSATSQAAGQRMDDGCFSRRTIATQATSEGKGIEARLSRDDKTTIVLATRELLAICARGSDAVDDEGKRKDYLMNLISAAIITEYVPGPGSLRSLRVDISAEPKSMATLKATVCESGYVNIEPFIVTAPGGPRRPPDEGYVLIQRTEGGDAAFVWRELWNGGAAIPSPGQEYTVTVVAFLNRESFRARQAVNSAALVDLPDRPGCKIIALQLTAVRYQ
jgi:hypothetical protein